MSISNLSDLTKEKPWYSARYNNLILDGSIDVPTISTTNINAVQIDVTTANIGTANLSVGLNLPNGGSILDYYASKQTLSATLKGSISAVISLEVTRIGSQVFLRFPSIVQASSGGSITTSSGPITANYRPPNNTFFPIILEDNSAVLNDPGLLQINTAGNLTITPGLDGLGTFTAAGDCGVPYYQQFSWSV